MYLFIFPWELKMAGDFQDDVREDEMRKLFKLYKSDDEGRSGIDAFLQHNGKIIPFELKTTSNGSVTTVRDFGLDHIEKWKNKHWLIGFFLKGRRYYKYGSPSMMEPWIMSKKQYIAPDYKLANLVSSKLTLDDMFNIIGEKEIYSYEDAKSIQKLQYSKKTYLELYDLNSGYSQNRMLEIIKDRAKYLVERGSTLNNPHIPFNYFDGWPEITDTHDVELRTMVEQSFKA